MAGAVARAGAGAAGGPAGRAGARAAARDAVRPGAPEDGVVDVGAGPAVPRAVNVSIVAGVASAPPRIRGLPSGRTLAGVSIRVPGADGPATSVPVAVWDPPAWVATVVAGDGLVVVGRVVRRFYRSGGGTASRVEVEALSIARAPDRRRREAAWRRASGLLDALLA